MIDELADDGGRERDPIYATTPVVASLQRFIECGWDFPINSENQYTNEQLGNPNEDAIDGETIMVFYPDSQRFCVRGNEAEAWYVYRDGRVALDMLPAC